MIKVLTNRLYMWIFRKFLQNRVLVGVYPQNIRNLATIHREVAIAYAQKYYEDNIFDQFDFQIEAVSMGFAQAAYDDFHSNPSTIDDLRDAALKCRQYKKEAYIRPTG